MQRFYHTDILFFLWGMEKAPMAGYLIGVNQKIQLLIKITFLRQVKTTVRLGIKFRFSIMGFSTSDYVLGLWFFSLTIPLFEQNFQPEGYDQNLRH